MLDVKAIKEIYNMFKDTQVGEIEIENQSGRVRIALGTGEQPLAVAERKSEFSKLQATKQVLESTMVGSEARESPTESPAQEIVELRSNWVGFFTRLNPKNGEAYVKLRDIVHKGDVIAHVRVLGLMHDLKATVDGKVKEILVEEGQPIEFGQPIMRFEVQRKVQ